MTATGSTGDAVPAEGSAAVWPPPVARPDLTRAPVPPTAPDPSGWVAPSAAAGWPPVPPPKRRTGPIIGLVAGGVVLLLLVAGVASLPFLLRGNGRTVSPVAATARPNASPTPPPLSTEVYQQALDTLDQNLGPKVTALGAAGTNDQLRTAWLAFSNAVDDERRILDKLTPPAPVRAAHKDLRSSLTFLGTDLSRLLSELLAGQVCGGGAALPDLSNRVGATQLRLAITELATADPAHAYRVGAFLPPATVAPARTQANGARLKSPASSSSNRLKVENPGPRDTVVSGAPPGSKKATFMVYLKAGQNATFTGIPNGSIDLFLTSGEDWDPAAKAFTRNCGYNRAEPTLKFSASGGSYTIGTITVDTIALGTNLDDAVNFPT